MSAAAAADSPQSDFFLDRSFLKTRRGVILAIEMLFQLLLFTCLAAAAAALLAAPLIFLIINICFLVVYLTHYHQHLAGLSWPCTDFVRAAVSGLIFLILSSVVAARSDGAGTAIASVLGFMLTGVLVYDAYDLYRNALTGQSQEQGESCPGGADRA